MENYVNHSRMENYVNHVAAIANTERYSSNYSTV